jgi:hypothetical protein
MAGDEWYPENTDNGDRYCRRYKENDMRLNREQEDVPPGPEGTFLPDERSGH